MPLADIFNHKGAVVSLAGNYQIQPTCFGDDGSSSDDDDDAGMHPA